MSLQVAVLMGLLVSASISPPAALAFGKAKHEAPLPTVERVDLSRYLGLWYEIARLPQSFEKDCTGVTAHYSLRDDQKIAVENRCLKGSLTGPEKIAHGVARVVDTESNSKLRVSFFRPFWGNYWILELGADYEYAAVGAPDRKSLWILSRTPRVSEELLQEILDRRAAQGFDVSRMERTVH